jgi:hypothetical protein
LSIVHPQEDFESGDFKVHVSNIDAEDENELDENGEKKKNLKKEASKRNVHWKTQISP